MKRCLPFHSNSVWPPLWMLAVFIIAYGLLEGGLRLIEFGSPNLKGEIFSAPEVTTVRSLILGTAAAFYALYRLWRFHPACNLGYAAWLRSSPWTPNKPLPLGPVHLVWQDAVVLVVLTVLARWHAHVDPALPVIVFGLTYLIAMTLLLAFTRTWVPCLLLGLLWPTPMLPTMRGLPAAGIFAALVLVIWYGHRRSLRAFPWRRDGPEAMPPARAKSLLQTEIRIEGLSTSPASAITNLGWPFRWLSPKLQCNFISASTSLSLSALFGWWTYCAMVGLEMPLGPVAILFFAAIASLLRFAIYCSGLGPSFNLWGRLASGRIFVPGFDQVLVTPLVVVALAIGGGVAIRHAGSWSLEASAFMVALIWFALLSGRPTMRKWILTGQHRYRAPSRLGANKQLLRPI